MDDDKSTEWATGSRFVQWQKNFAKHRIVGRSPCTVLFGGEPRMGLASTNVLPSIVKTIHSEEELQKFLGKWVTAEGIEDEDEEEDEISLRRRKIKDAQGET